MSDALAEWRKKIDAIDYQIHDLLNERAKLALEVGATKYQEDGPLANFYRPEREAQILAQISEHNHNGVLSDHALHRIFRDIMRESRHLQQQTYGSKVAAKIGVQGIAGSFSEIAALQVVHDRNLQNYQLEYLVSSENVLREIEFGQIPLGVVAVYNTIGGLVDETLLALAKYRCKINNIIAVEVVQNLMVLPGTQARAVTSIHSHPQAIKQSMKFLREHFAHAKIVEEADTAGSAQKLQQGELPPTAAVIGSRNCLQHYGLEILQAGIQEMKENFTQFLVVEGL